MLFESRSTRSQAGLSLLELSISLAIASAAVILALKKSVEELHDKSVQKEGKWVVEALRGLGQHKGSSSDYSNMTDLTMGTITAVPKAYLDTTVMGVTKIRNGFGGTVHVGPLSLGGVNNAYALNFTAIPRESCPKLIMAMYFNSIDVAPLFGLVGHVGQTAAVPAISLAGNKLVATGATVLLHPDQGEGPDLSVVAKFCNSVGASSNALRSLTLVRRP
jgi:PilS N terminal